MGTPWWRHHCGNWRPHLHRYTCRLRRKINVFSWVSKNIGASKREEIATGMFYLAEKNAKLCHCGSWLCRKLKINAGSWNKSYPQTTKQKAKIWKRRAKTVIVEEGIEPNPGPHHLCSNLVTQPILSKQSMCRARLGLGGPSVLGATLSFFCKTPLSRIKNSNHIFRPARLRNYRTYHVEPSKVSGYGCLDLPTNKLFSFFSTRMEPLHLHQWRDVEDHHLGETPKHPRSYCTAESSWRYQCWKRRTEPFHPSPQQDLYKIATHNVALHLHNPAHERELLQKISQVGKTTAKAPASHHSKN